MIYLYAQYIYLMIDQYTEHNLLLPVFLKVLVWQRLDFEYSFYNFEVF